MPTREKRRPSESSRLNPPPFHSRWHHLRALRRALELERASLPRKAVVVDLGCGDMPYRALFAAHCERYLGVDLGRNALADLHFDACARAPLPDQSADVVLSSQVLEHVESPAAYLAEAHRLLKPGGVLVLSTHGYWMYHPDPTDFWRWTRDGLARLLASGGFELLSIKGVMNLAASGLQLFQDGLAGGLPSWLRPPFFYIVNRAMALVDHLGSEESRNRDACVFVVRAAKRAGLP